MKQFLKSKKAKVILIVVIVVVILVALIGRAVSKMTSAVETAMNLVQVETVQKRDLSESISLTGTAAGISKTNVTSRAAAEVTAVNVQVGDQVKAGDLLCTLDSTDIEEQIATAEKTINNESAVESNTAKQNAQALEDAKADQASQLADAQTAIDQAQEDCNAANAKLEADRNTLAAKQAELATVQSNYDNAKAAAEAAPDDENLQKAYSDAAEALTAKQAEVSSAQESVSADEASVKEYQRAVTSAQSSYNSIKSSTDKAISSAQNTVDMEGYQTSDSTADKTLKDLQAQLADCQIVAPCDGVVTAVNVSVGDNNTANAVILSIEDTSSMKINATVNEDDILKIEEGMKAVVMTGATGDDKMEGTVTRVVKVKNESTAADGTTTSSGYAAEITVENSQLLVGMSAKVKVMIQDKGEALAVPYDLIQNDDNGDTYVMVANDNGDGTYTAAKCKVTAGDEVNYYTEITGGNLKEGDLLVYDTSIAEGDTFSADQTYSEDDANQTVDGTMEDTE